MTAGLEPVEGAAGYPERTQQEFALQLTLGSALMASKGYGAPEVEHAYARACELAQQVGDARELFGAAWPAHL